MEFISVEDQLPESQSIDEVCNNFLVVIVEGYGIQKAMFCDGEWYSDYYSKIFRPVTHWLKIEGSEPI